MKYFYIVFIVIFFFFPLIAAERTLQKNDLDKQIADNIIRWEYQRMTDSFRNLDFLVAYDTIYQRYKVLIYPKDNPMVCWFYDYKNFILNGYKQGRNRIQGKQCGTTISDDSSDLIYAHITMLKAWPKDSPYATPDLLLKQKVWKAFKNQNMDTLSMLLEGKNL